MTTHKHHLIPSHLGESLSDLRARIGTLDLTVEQHADAHRILYELFGRKEDKTAYQGLAGIITHEEAVREAALAGAEKGRAIRAAHPEIMFEWYQTDAGTAKRKQQSEMMRNKNPMKNPETVEKIRASRTGTTNPGASAAKKKYWASPAGQAQKKKQSEKFSNPKTNPGDNSKRWPNGPGHGQSGRDKKNDK